MKTKNFKGTICFIFLFVFWGVLSYLKIVDPIFLPTPTKVISAFFILLNEQSFLNDILITTSRVLVGFIFASTLAIPIAVGMAGWKLVDDIFRPFAAFTRYLPVSAFIPLLILWTGIGFTQKVCVIFLGVFFHLTILAADDCMRVPKEIKDTARVLGAGKYYLARRVILPYSLPAIFDNMRIMLGAAWTYLIVAELVAANSGIGNMMIESQRFLKTDRVIAGIFTVGVIGLGTDAGFRMLARRIMPWTKVV